MAKNSGGTKTLTGVYEIGTDLYSSFIDFNMKSGGNLLVFGNAGIGKTEIPIAMCKESNIPFVYWNLSTQEAPDLVGLPVEKPGEDRVHYLAAPYMPVTELTKEPTVIIIDEADKAKPELQNPLLEVLHLRTINGRPLNVKAIILTANLPDENAFSRPMSHALTNRCSVFKLRADFEAWQGWATKNNVNPLVVGYLSKNQSEILGKASDDPTAYCARSPRSWTMAARDVDMLAGSSVDRKMMAVAGRVGVKPASDFKAWLDHYETVEPIVQEIIAGRVPDRAKDLTVDRALVCAISATSRIRQRAIDVKTKANLQKGQKPNADMMKEVQKITQNVSKFLLAIPDEFKYAAVKSTLETTLIAEFNLLSVKELAQVYSTLHKVIT